MDIRVIRSKRKTVAIQVKGPNDVVVRAPYRMTNREIQEFVEKNMDWILKNLEKVAAEKEKE